MGNNYQYRGEAVRVKETPDSHKVLPGIVYITDAGGHPKVSEGQVLSEDFVEKRHEMKLDINECRAYVPETGEIVAIPGLGQRRP